MLFVKIIENDKLMLILGQVKVKLSLAPQGKDTDRD